MGAILAERIEVEFESLPSQEKLAIISHGAALRLSTLKKRLFLAESKIRSLQEKHHTSLTDLEAEGLPDDADYEMHEDYIMWHHWAEVYEKVKGQIARLEPLLAQGLYVGEELDVSG